MIIVAWDRSFNSGIGKGASKADVFSWYAQTDVTSIGLAPLVLITANSEVMQDLGAPFVGFGTQVFKICSPVALGHVTHSVWLFRWPESFLSNLAVFNDYFPRVFLFISNPIVILRTALSIFYFLSTKSFSCITKTLSGHNSITGGKLTTVMDSSASKLIVETKIDFISLRCVESNSVENDVTWIHTWATCLLDLEVLRWLSLFIGLSILGVAELDYPVSPLVDVGLWNRPLNTFGVGSLYSRCPVNLWVDFGLEGESEITFTAPVASGIIESTAPVNLAIDMVDLVSEDVRGSNLASWSHNLKAETFSSLWFPDTELVNLVGLYGDASTVVSRLVIKYNVRKVFSWKGVRNIIWGNVGSVDLSTVQGNGKLSTHSGAVSANLGVERGAEGDFSLFFN